MATLLAAAAVPAVADVVTDWNLITLNATKTAGLNSNLGSRIDAIEAIAVYDAVNSIRQFGTPYHFYSPGTGSAQAAAAQAAHDVLVNYFPAQQAALDTALANSLSNLSDGTAGNGPAIGSAAAADIIALRLNDGASPNLTYSGPASIAPGIYQLTPNVPTVTVPPFTYGNGINQQWGTVKPFLLASTNQFRPGPPPALTSVEYSNALQQVQSLGAINSGVRTTEQTHIAQFYKQDAELTVNEAARQLALGRGTSLEENALLFVLADIAVADARIAIWDAKYTYLFWRAVTALNANADGTVTNNYSAWQPLLVTPNHPDYPSGHSGTVNAGFEVLKAFFGDFNALQLHTTTAGETPRVVNSLSKAESENGWSRIYGGIHYWFDNTTGQAVGNQVAAYVLANGPAFATSTCTNAPTLGIANYPGIRLAGLPGQVFRVEYANSINASNWTLLKIVTLPSATPYFVLDNSTISSSPQRFYRAVSVSN
ncbi:MAG TPA: vanadium-dependent haloperoxidase [Verrucomicrobiae bacterium]